MNLYMLNRDALIAQIAIEVDKALDEEIKRSELESDGTLTYPKSRFDRSKIEDNLIMELRSELEKYEELDYFPGCANEKGELILRGLFNQIENRKYDTIHDYFWEAYTERTPRITDWLDKHIDGDVDQWADDFIKHPSIEALRVVGGIDEWDVKLISCSLLEGLNEIDDAGKLSLDDRVLDIFGTNGSYDEFGLYLVDMHRARDQV